MARFKYLKEKISPFGSVVLRPAAVVYLKTKNNSWYKYQPYIDSGADVSLIPFFIGKTIGLEVDKNKIQSLGGISGGVPVIYTKVDLKIAEKEIVAKVAWAQTDNVPSLLGRADVFNKFKITFDEAREEIIFE